MPCLSTRNENLCKFHLIFLCPLHQTSNCHPLTCPTHSHSPHTHRHTTIHPPTDTRETPTWQWLQSDPTPFSWAPPTIHRNFPQTMGPHPQTTETAPLFWDSPERLLFTNHLLTPIPLTLTPLLIQTPPSHRDSPPLLREPHKQQTYPTDSKYPGQTGGKLTEYLLHALWCWGHIPLSAITSPPSL